MILAHSAAVVGPLRHEVTGPHVASVESPNLFQETRPGRFIFHDEVVPPFKRDKPSPGDPGGHSTSFFEGYGRFIAAGQHNRRDGDLGKKGVYVYVVDNLICSGVCRLLPIVTSSLKLRPAPDPKHPAWSRFRGSPQIVTLV